MTVAKKSSPAVMKDSYDLSNAVAFAIGVGTQFIAQLRRKTAAVNLSYLYSDKDLCEIRALCMVRNIVLKNVSAIRRQQNYILQPLSSLLRFPGFVDENIPEVARDAYNALGSIYQRMGFISKEITKRSQAINKYIPAEEPHPEWVRSLFDFPVFKSEEDFVDFSRKFIQNQDLYPCRMYLDCKPDDTVLNSDFFLLFAVYKKFNAGPPNRELYKISRSTQEPKGDYDTLNGSDNALTFLKSAFSEPDTKNIFVVDTQNLKSETVYSFLDWISREYSDASIQVYLYVDGWEHWSWNTAEAMIHFPVQRVKSQRVVSGKSSVDTTLASHLVKLYYEEAPDRVFIFSSDCDFIPLTDVLPNIPMCFCGISGSISTHSIDAVKDKPNATYIILDEFLGFIEAQDTGRYDNATELASLLNQKHLSATKLIEEIKPLCQKLGRRNDDVIAVSMLNQVFLRFHLRVSAEGFLEFKPPWEHWA